ncbi:MAG TPA: TIGR03960 family B12-binding radical SAM protein [Pirellulales bacterium]|nr:TIGR03960 family B12-binding radical SAM protein [Pirellulales bacterium]
MVPDLWQAVVPVAFDSMLNERLKRSVEQLLPRVQRPAQYLGGELNSVRKRHDQVRGTLCLAFPDTYTIGMSHHGLQVLYTLMNAREDWSCERVFTPWGDMERELRAAPLPLYSLETFTPLSEFDVLGFTLQYELSYTNVLTMLDLGGIPLSGEARTLDDPLVIAGGPCAQNPEPLADFIDVFVIGDGEPSLPRLCDAWLDIREAMRADEGTRSGMAGRDQRERALLQLAARLPFAYVPRWYEAEYDDAGHLVATRPTHALVPQTIEPSVIDDFDGFPLPLAPIVPVVECVHDRIAIEIMRGCPWQCRFCQSTVIKRPLRVRRVETIVAAALAAYQNTGFSEISLLSLSSSDYPWFGELLERMHETFQPLGVKLALPSLRVNEQLRGVAALLSSDRRGLTLAPEVARDDMREQIRKKITNEDLYVGCREAFRHGWRHVKLYFMCGLPGERPVDLDGIVEMAETISRIGKEELGHYAKVTASVSNFVPKPHTPYQWNGMQSREYLRWARGYLMKKRRIRAVDIKCHPIEDSLVEGVLSRGDRRVGAAILLAWQRGARLDSWGEHFDAARWWQAFADAGIDVPTVLHHTEPLDARLPWDHINVRKGRTYLEKEQARSVLQLASMADAV